MENEVSVWTALLKDVGFPIVIAAYLLLRFEKKIEKLTAIITELKKVIQKNKE